jgi:hypothetical protein
MSTPDYTKLPDDKKTYIWDELSNSWVEWVAE